MFLNKKMKIERVHLPHIGLRIIKSAVGVLICFVIYFLRGKQGTPFYSALAVLWCIQNQTKNTVNNAIQYHWHIYRGGVRTYLHIA